jgi:steroid delta-isomerase-like uncharacterized protein
MTREQVLDVVTRWEQALGSRNLEALAALYAAEAEVVSPLGGTATGRDAIMTIFEAFLAAFPDASFEFGDPIIDGNRVAARTSISGTQRGPLLGLPPSGRAFQFRVAGLFELEDGKIVRERRIYDFTGLLIQLGVLKARPA